MRIAPPAVNHVAYNTIFLAPIATIFIFRIRICICEIPTAGECLPVQVRSVSELSPREAGRPAAVDVIVYTGRADNDAVTVGRSRQLLLQVTTTQTDFDLHLHRIID